MAESHTSPQATEEDHLSFSLSDDEAEDTTDSLDIKPPQAAVLPRKQNRHRKEKLVYRETKHVYVSRKAHHSRTDSHRKEYKSDRIHRERDVYIKRRDDDGERKERGRNYSRSKKELNHREERRVQEVIKIDNEHSSEDLRGRILEKRGQREGKSEAEPDKKRPKKEKEKRDKEKIEEVPYETEKEKHERVQREERKAKLIEAEREMALRKEVSHRELAARRERHNIEKEKHRMLNEIAKKHKMEKDDGEEKSENEEGEIAEKTEDEEEEEDSDSSSSSSSSDSADTTEGEEKSGTPESALPLEKSPRTPDGHPPSLGSSRELTPESREKSEELMEDVQEDDNDDDSPKSDFIMKESLPHYLPAIQGCRSVEEFQCLNRIEEGTYGVVYRARDKRTSDIVALKRLKMEKEKEGFPITSLREINTLLKAQHPNIVTVREIVVGSNMDKIFIVMDYVEHDLKSLMETMKAKKQVFVPGEIKCLMLQLLRAVNHLHDNWILHRDLKTSNLLLSHKGVLKVGDFGLAREYGSPLRAYTPIVVTLWYRAPELLLQTKQYTTAIDVWSVGCIFGELLQMEALFPGRSEMDQLNRIFKELGTPNEKSWPGCSKLPVFQKVPFAEHPVNQIRSRFGTMLSDLGISLMNNFLTYDPTKRTTAEDALQHDYFKEAPLPIDPAMFPTWPAKSEQGVKKVNNSPKPPSGGKAYKQLGDTDEEVPSGGFHMGGVERRINALVPGFSLKF